MAEVKKQPVQTNLEKLITGLFLLKIKHESEEARYSAIGRQTFGYIVVNKRHVYASEIKRVLNELHLTHALLAEVKELKKTRKSQYEPEEIISYYDGIFLDLVHQLKDKVLRLIDYMAANEVRKKPYDEPENIKVTKLISKHSEVVDKIGIKALIEQWGQDTSVIGIVLRRRTQHHHFQSKLQSDKNFMDTKTSKFVLSNIERLTDYGKQRMSELETDAYAKYRDNIVDKQALTLANIESNLEQLADNLLKHYSLPTEDEQKVQIVNDYTAFLSSLDIKNDANISKLQPEIKILFGESLKAIKKDAPAFKSIYLTGSVGRGEFIVGSSDLNLYMITEGQTLEFDSELPFTLHVISEEDFLSDKHQKDRFIIWSDGVLLEGHEYKFKTDDFPKPGTLLALLLNKGYAEKLKKFKDEVIKLVNPTNVELRLYALKIAKIEMDYDFGVAMSNKPFYSASRKAKIAHVKQVFPGHTRTNILEQIYDGANVKHEDFVVLIDAFLESAKSTYPKMLAVKESIDKEKG